MRWEKKSRRHATLFASPPFNITTPSIRHEPGTFSDIYEIVTGHGWHATQLKLEIDKPLSHGAQGEVLNAILKSDDTEYDCVVKRLFTMEDPTTPQEFKLQEELTREGSSEELGTLKIMGIHVMADRFGRAHKCAIMPKCEITLSDCIESICELNKNANTKILFQHVILNFLFSMSHSLENLNVHEVVHRDLKPQNIGLHENGWCIFDFGLAQRYAEFQTNKKNQTTCGTAYYIPPEVLNNEWNNPFAADVWAIGQILLQLRGNAVNFSTNKEGDWLANHAHLYVKWNAYLEKRKEAQENKHPPIDANAHQEVLLDSFNNTKKFEDCLNLLLNAMCDLYPERRPNLTTIQCACSNLESLLPELDSTFELANFYEEIMNRKAPTISCSP